MRRVGDGLKEGSVGARWDSRFESGVVVVVGMYHIDA